MATKLIYLEETTPIPGHPGTAWDIRFDDGQTLLEIWDPNARIEQVVEVVQRYHPGRPFTVGRIDVGIFEVKRVESSYSGDARRVNQDGEVVI